MRTNALRIWLICALLALSSALSPSPAQAFGFDDFVGLIKLADDNGVNPFPVHASDIQNSKELIDCLEDAAGKNDVAVAQCVETYKDTPIGQQAFGAAGLPSWFWDLLDTYIAFRQEDYWGVVAHLGEAALCVVGQVMSGGVDLCAAIAEVVELAKKLLSTGEALLEFVGDLGGAAWDTLKSAGCSLGLGGCGGDPPVVILYNTVFKPRIGDGRKALEAASATAFDELAAQLKAAAGKGIQLGLIPFTFSKAEIDAASGSFEKAVDAQWTKDMVDPKAGVLLTLAKKRGEYDSPAQIHTVAAAAAQGYWDKKSPVQSQITQHCTNDFTGAFGFAHVDRWIARHPDQAQTMKAMTNGSWCAQTFFKKNAGKFAGEFGDFLKAHGCAQSGAAITCQDLHAFDTCFALMSSVGSAQQCRPSAQVQQSAAAQIAADFKQHHSKYPCKTDAGKQPAEFVCARPVQGQACQHFYSVHFGKYGKANPLLACVVSAGRLDAYAALRLKVAGAAASLTEAYKAQGSNFWISKQDPLIVITGSKTPVTVMDAVFKQNLGFAAPSQKPGFAQSPLEPGAAVDGVDTPVLERDLSGLLGTKYLPVTAPGKPDPINKLPVQPGQIEKQPLKPDTTKKKPGLPTHR